MVLLLLFQLSYNTAELSTCWIGSVGAEGDSGCDVDAASEHSSDTAGRRGARCKAIDGDKECVGRNQATPRTPAPALLQPHQSHLDQNFLLKLERGSLCSNISSKEGGSVARFFLIVSSYLLCLPSHILPCCRRDSSE